MTVSSPQASPSRTTWPRPRSAWSRSGPSTTWPTTAWSASIEHIRATPGFEGRGWPPPGGMTLEENRGDLERHARDFAARTGFTYSVLEPDADDVLGCVYIYPARDDEHDAEVASWVRASAPALDRELHAVVSRWLEDAWPFTAVKYADRGA